jgi:hypothetical protein
MMPNKYPLGRCEYLLPAGCKDLIDVLRLQEGKGNVAKGQKQCRLFLRKLAEKEMPVIRLPSQVVVKELAVALRAHLYSVINALKQMGVFTSVNQKIPFYTASKVAKRYGYKVKREGS